VRSSASASLLALICTFGAVAATPCDAALLSPEQVQQAASAVQADPLFGGKHMERKLRWKPDDSQKARKEQATQGEPSWLQGLGQWLAESGRLLMWLMGAAGVAILAVCARRWIVVNRGYADRGAVVRPSHVRDLDIRPESLPDDIAGAARTLWMRGEQRASLSLLYRGAVSRLVHHFAVPIRAASTEGDCVDLAQRALPSEASGFFEGLVKAWLLLVYGAHIPDTELVMSLCDGFDAQLPAGAAPTQVAA